MKRQRRALRHRRRLRGALARQPWAGPLLALALVVNGGALGYRITEKLGSSVNFMYILKDSNLPQNGYQQWNAAAGFNYDF